MTHRTGKARSNIVRSFVFLFASLLVVAMLAPSTVKNSAFAADNKWYVGEGAQPDTYVKYRIEFFETNNGRPFEMTIYFQERDEDGNWIAPVFVEDEGRVIKGTFRLTDLDLTALGGSSEIPPELSTYRSAYANSLQWLAAFVPKPGKDLDAASWGRIASIGGSPIEPKGNEQITVSAFPEPIETTRIIYHKSVDNIIWVKNEFPLPVKALTFGDVTTGTAQTQFAFELLETGKGQPEAPGETGFVPTPPLRESTATGTYKVELDWTPESIDINQGKDVTFGVTFYDSSDFPIERVNYNFAVSDGSGTVIQEFNNQFAADGTAQHKVTFADEGRFTVNVDINHVNSVPPRGGFVEGAEFNVVVVPEFPVSLALLVGGIISFVVVMTRFRGIPKIGHF